VRGGKAFSTVTPCLRDIESPSASHSKREGRRREGGEEGEVRGEEGGLEGPPFRVGIGPPEGLIQHWVKPLSN